ncbi:NAD-binding protein [Thermosynechococcaceae cyanobacterium BACA0444]|uniref:NAD-binding protein n=1 Tax=Pseudocalidococcus azoricus BACA0444 TaxID=2918990 RepID=A0AAE4FU76_9CYAN|nr:NAD-binding protein [Pseudocalidococcus azoricus]MDS3861667.1 NAD-binding protein [Pseudocalidococcus azoricus BACA0444]
MVQSREHFIPAFGQWLREIWPDATVAWELTHHGLYGWITAQNFPEPEALNQQLGDYWISLRSRSGSWPPPPVTLFAAGPDEAFPRWQVRHPPLALQRLHRPLDPGGDTEIPSEMRLANHFIICGLGSLGQYCYDCLQQFATPAFPVQLTAIEVSQPGAWEVQGIADTLGANLMIGDCRQASVLEQAGIGDCRAILLVTSDEATNVAAAIAARRLNPNVHLVVRSARQNLNHLLQEKLGRFVALNPTELPAPSFALAGLGEGTLGLFTINDQQLRVVEQRITATDSRFAGINAHQWSRRQQRLFSIFEPVNNPQTPSRYACFFPASESRIFHQWRPDHILGLGDRLVWAELVSGGVGVQGARSTTGARRKFLRQLLNPWSWEQKLKASWAWLRGEERRWLIVRGLGLGSVLWGISTLLLRFNVPHMTWQKAFFSGFILLLGGFGDVFGGLEPEDIPFWVMAFCLLVTLMALLFILGVLGLVTEQLLQSRFSFLKRRPPLPQAGHVILVGFGRLGQQVADILLTIRQPLVIISDSGENIPPLTIPYLSGDVIQTMEAANLATAKSIILTNEDQMLNLEAALIARDQAQGDLGLVIRTFDQLLSENLGDLLPGARSLCAYALAAEAFAAAALGENVLGLFRLQDRTILVTDYQVTMGDTLLGLGLAEVAYGYGVVPIFYEKQGKTIGDERKQKFFPTDDMILGTGDRLVVLASIQGLQRIEQGKLIPPRLWRLWADAPLSSEVALDAGNILTNISGCHLNQARDFIQSLPGTIELKLYDHQAYRLGQQLSHLLTIRLYPV